MIKNAPRYQSTKFAQEQQREAAQQAAMHIAIKNRQADKIRGIRVLINQIIDLKDEGGLTYREIGETLNGDIADLDIDIPEEHLPGVIGSAYRAELADEGAVDSVIERINANRALKKEIIETIEQTASHGILRDSQLKERLIAAGILSATSAKTDAAKEERRIFKIAIQDIHSQWQKWHASRDADLNQ